MRRLTERLGVLTRLLHPRDEPLPQRCHRSRARAAAVAQQLSVVLAHATEQAVQEPDLLHATVVLAVFRGALFGGSLRA